MKIFLLSFMMVFTCLPVTFAATPAKQAPKAESKFIPEMTYRSWEQKYLVLKKQVNDLKGSKPIRKIRDQIKKELKQTQKLMKKLNRLDARKPIQADRHQTYLDETSAIINRLNALTQNLSLASIPSDASAPKKEQWSTNQKEVLTQLEQVEKTLESTQESLKKLTVLP